MTIAERHRHILGKLQDEGYVRVADLSDELRVSAVTVRKDLRMLEARNLLYRSHGSASSRELYVNDRPVSEKEAHYATEKLRIAQAATHRLRADDAIIIGSGTTTLTFARNLPKELPLRVLTSALNVSMAMIPHKQVEVVQLGGMVRKSSTSAVGPYAEEMIQHFACNKLFLGVDGLTTDYGLTTSDMMESHLNRMMIKAAQTTIVLADHSKFGRKGFGRISGVEDVDVIITDRDLPDSLAEELTEAGVEVERV
jgi:DeoR family transcriptional regulator, aga operon transcriptional repressor